MSDPEAQQRLVKDLSSSQPAPPAQPRSERGFIRSHLPHLRLGSHNDRKHRRASLNQEAAEIEGFSITQQGSENMSGTGDDDAQVDSLSAELLANSHPLSRRSGPTAILAKARAALLCQPELRQSATVGQCQPGDTRYSMLSACPATSQKLNSTQSACSCLLASACFAPGEASEYLRLCSQYKGV